jgi:hypothetical protein
MPKAYKILKRSHIQLGISLDILIFIIIMSIFTSNNPQRILARNNETNTNNSNEFQSYIHFKDYLLTGNLMENETSVQLLSDALRYEAESFAAFKSVSTSTNDGNACLDPCI